jgi:CheY-like chemotaxis protein
MHGRVLRSKAHQGLRGSFSLARERLQRLKSLPQYEPGSCWISQFHPGCHPPLIKDFYLMHILLADHHNQLRRALGTLIKIKTENTLVGEATDWQELLSKAVQTQPDVVLMDWELPGLAAKEGLARLQNSRCCPKLIIMSSHFEIKEQALEAGADAFVSKGDPPKNLLVALQNMQISLDEQSRNHSNQPQIGIINDHET